MLKEISQEIGIDISFSDEALMREISDLASKKNSRETAKGGGRIDEVTFILRLLSDNWASTANSLVNDGTISASHNETPKFIDVRSIQPNEGRRVDVDSQSVIIVFEDSSSTEYPTIDYSVEERDVHLHTPSEGCIEGTSQNLLFQGID